MGEFREFFEERSLGVGSAVLASLTQENLKNHSKRVDVESVRQQSARSAIESKQFWRCVLLSADRRDIADSIEGKRRAEVAEAEV